MANPTPNPTTTPTSQSQSQSNQHQQQQPAQYDSLNSPTDLALLSLTLLQTESYDSLKNISSIYLKERIEIMDSHDTIDKFPLFVWNRYNPSLPNFKTQYERDLVVLKALVEGFSVEVECGIVGRGGRVWYRVWDEETVQCAVRVCFDDTNDGDGEICDLMGSVHFGDGTADYPTDQNDSIEKDKSQLQPESSSLQGAVVILYQQNLNNWCYHDIKPVTNWKKEYGSNWFSTLEEAKEAYEVLSKDGFLLKDRGAGNSKEDLEYWFSYDVVDLKPLGKSGGAESKKPTTALSEEQDDEDEDDYWDDYEAISSKF
ncbi:hypothetical protein HDU76_008675 [Blyttiomyces sp. JEL0837]|nr:hypothetical protein HDU76_008675 [Blyttiomyces sp. JEL0837]